MQSGFSVGDQGETVAEIQENLEVIGFDPGPIDGIFGGKTRRAVGQFQRRHLVTGIVDAHTRAKLAQAAIAEKERQKMTVTVPSGLAEIEDTFGKLEFEEAEGGFVVVTNDWAKDNLITTRLPIVGKVAVHKLLAGVFRDVLGELDTQRLGDEIRQFGVWSTRHKMHNPSRGLSSHSWAIACDINWAENPVGRVGAIDPRIVAAFENRGFRWGGRWRTRDDMHFQYCRNY
jgi:hypothetical protein